METTTDPEAGSGSFITPPEAIDAVMENPPMGGGMGERLKMNPHACGIICNARHILAWNYLDGNDIGVRADRIGLGVDEDGAMQWHISLQTCNGVILEGVASCGRWCVNALVRGLRNAMTSRKNTVRIKHQKYKASKAAAAAAAAKQQAEDSKPADPLTFESKELQDTLDNAAAEKVGAE